MCRSGVHHLEMIYLFLLFSDAKEASLFAVYKSQPSNLVLKTQKKSWWLRIMPESDEAFYLIELQKKRESRAALPLQVFFFSVL